jgi:hypothetical protein
MLATGSVLNGFLCRDLLIGVGMQSQCLSPTHSCTITQCEFTQWTMKLVPVCLSIMSGMLSVQLYHEYRLVSFGMQTTMVNMRGLPSFLYHRWFMDRLHNQWFNASIVRTGYMVPIKYTDKGYLETVGPNGVHHVTAATSHTIAQVHNGLLVHSYLIMVFGFTVLVWSTMTATLCTNVTFTDEHLWFILILFLWVATP